MNFKSLLIALASISVIGSPALADIQSIPGTDTNGNSSASASIPATATPEQTAFSVAAASITIDPALLVSGQKFTITLPITNKALKTTTNFVATISSLPSWLDVIIANANQSVLGGSQPSSPIYTFTVKDIPANTGSATFSLVINATKQNSTSGVVVVSPQ